MLKKTTIYLEESELNNLKALSFLQNKSVAELIRLGVKRVYKSASHEERKFLETLNKIRKNAKTKGYSNKKIMSMAMTAQKEVRSERYKKKTRRY
ncbi:MAG: hypothetical protein OXK80_02670 [Bdellovibrionales bacterium]|nr:hypothetical protein [Bdellovibrionales bacterium]